MREHTVAGGGGVALHVVETGNPDGPPLLFLHGWSQSHLAWLPQLRSELARDFRLVAVDLRGHGRSGKPADAYGDPDLWAADVHGAVTELGLQRPVVTAWSYGGLVLCDYLRVHGDGGLAAVHLVGAITELGTERAATAVGAEFVAAARDSYRTDVTECVEGIERYLRVMAGDTLTAEAAALLLGINVQVPPHVRKRLFTRRVTNDDVLRALTVPLLVTHGDADRVVLPVAGERHAALVPNAQHSVYRGVGHAPFAEDPDRFNVELRAFAQLPNVSTIASIRSTTSEPESP